MEAGVRNKDHSSITRYRVDSEDQEQAHKSTGVFWYLLFPVFPRHLCVCVWQSGGEMCDSLQGVVGFVDLWRSTDEFNTQKL